MSIGAPLPRPDGPDKVTGRARYAADRTLPDLRYAVLVGSPVPAGRLVCIETARALQQPSVECVLTADDLPRLGPVTAPAAASGFIPMQGPEILHEDQPVAMVIARTLEAAEQAARDVRVEVEPALFIAHGRGTPVEPRKGGGYTPDPPDFCKGDFGAVAQAAAHRQPFHFSAPSRHGNPMEPCATVAIWEDDHLTVHDAVQHGQALRETLAAALELDIDRVRVLSPHTGGGFGMKSSIWPHQILAAVAARLVGKPIKLVLSRAQMYGMVGYQPAMTHDLELACDGPGRIQGIRHEVVNVTGMTEDFVESASVASRGVYAAPAILTTQRVQRANVNLPTSVRPPWEGPGLWPLESAMDEMAHALGQDPLDFRLLNYAETDPSNGKPWSSKKLREAYEEGARRFGWRERHTLPRREGPWHIGRGMATCSMGTFRFPARARLRLRADGSALIEAGCHDIGTGTRTIFPQIAAEALKIPASRIDIEMGDTRLPQTGPTHGSATTVGVGAAVLDAARKLQKRLAALAGTECFESEAIPALLKAAGLHELVAEGEFALPNGVTVEDRGETTPYSMRTFGALFVEVGIDPELGLLRLRRAVGCYSAGRIINPRTARAQMIGGIVCGWGIAAMEESRFDAQLGRWLSKNLSGVAIPCHADIPGDIDISFIDEFDEHAGPLGAKGIGELGATGVAGAVGNAVFDAIGVRICDLPITPERIVTALSAAA